MIKLAGTFLNKLSAISSKLPSALAIILVLQAALLISFFFDIAVARQVIGFLYLTFIPGFIIMKLLKQNNLGLAETILFSIGLSLAFALLAGLAANEVGLLIGIRQPLEPSLLVLLISGFVLLGALVNYFNGWQDSQPFGLTKSTVVKSFVLCLLPVLSIIGAFFPNVTDNNSILLSALLAVLAVFVVAVFFKRLITPKLYLIIVFMIAITLLFSYSLTSNFVQGADIKIEYFVAKLTKDAGFWNSTASFTEGGTARYYSMLSITLLPTIYSNILNMDIAWVFKIVFPLIFALVPLALYLLWRGKFGVAVALSSVFLFMSQNTFYSEMLSLQRQMIAEVFYVLLFLVIFSKSLSSRNGKILFIIFSFCLTISHYSVAMIFAFSISLMWLLARFIKKPIRHLSLSMVLIVIILMISWFIIESSTTLTIIAIDSRAILSGFTDFFNPAIRGTSVMKGIGLATASSPLYGVSTAIANTTEFFIVIGFLALLLQRKKKDFEYLIPCLVNLIILAMCILLPNLALTLNMERFYHIVLFFLAPLFAIGCIELFRFASKLLGVAAKRKTEICSLILMTLVLGSYFLFQTSIVYDVSGEESWSLPLSQYRSDYRLYSAFAFNTRPQVSGSEWLAQNTKSNLFVYADQSTAGNLLAYSGIELSKLSYLFNNESITYGQFIYLGELTTIYNKLEFNNIIYNASDTLVSLQLNTIYNNGFCEILTTTIDSRVTLNSID
jgi:uncharacterized membrane protein